MANNVDTTDELVNCFLGSIAQNTRRVQKESQQTMNFVLLSTSHTKWVPCQYSMECPQVADRIVGLQMYRVAINT